MCALILLHRVVPEFPVVLAANRDEFYDRPSSPPRRFDARIPYVAPKDERAGGTWIGTNVAGVVAAVTNRTVAGVADEPSRPSRGALVPEALSNGNLTAARVHLERYLAETPLNGFHLLVADAHDAMVVRGPNPIEFVRLEPGVHVITNLHELDEIELLEADRIAATANETSLVEIVGALAELLGSTEPVAADGFAPNKRRGDRGTVSSTILATAETNQAGRPAPAGMFLHADGAPDSTPYVDYAHQLRS